MSSSNLLKVEDLTTCLFTEAGRVTAVNSVSLEIGHGESVGLVGESGSGKSMTALSILGLQPSPPARIMKGRVLFEGRDVLKMTEEELRKIRGKDISMIFQDPATFLNPVMKIGDQIKEAIYVHATTPRSAERKKSIQNRVVELLRLVRIPDPESVMDRYPHELSGGMKQRVFIAMALAVVPKLLIADEPTTALDATIQAQIVSLLRDIRQKLGISLLLISHDLGLIAELCDRVYVIYGGRIVETGDVFSIFKPKHPYTQGLIDSAKDSGTRKGKFAYIDGEVADLANPPSGCSFHPRCKHAQSICSEKLPVLEPTGEGNLVACHRWKELDLKVET
ncbi:MAG: ABC transporter ATP-binding protein [Thaumarchaeota archaeon]|nr:ABC transporter ATP-binding protein [Nitrososphaerota archaeon]